MKRYNGFYLMGNYPDPKNFVEAALEGLKYFDFLEIGIPFSDPVADGPVIAEAAYESISKGFRFSELIENIKNITKNMSPDKKIYFMTYANIVYGKGIKNFAQASKKAGISGVIIPDVPYIESPVFTTAFEESGFEFIHFVSPENSRDQIKKIASNARGFLYFVSVRGITGGTLNLDPEIKQKLSVARKYSKAPVVLGFGIRDRASAREALKNADGFIIGTRIIELVKSRDINALRKFFDEVFISA